MNVYDMRLKLDLQKISTVNCTLKAIAMALFKKAYIKRA